MANEESSALIAYSALRFRALDGATEQQALKERFPRLESPGQREYVLLDDFTCVFRLRGRSGLFTTTVPRGCVANGVTGAPKLDSVHPPSWWLHDWHYATHEMTPQFRVQNAAGAAAVNDFEDHGAITLAESDAIFDPAALKTALQIATNLFGDAFWEEGQRIGRAVVPEWATDTCPEGCKIFNFPARDLRRETTDDGSVVYVLEEGGGGGDDKGGSKCCVVM